MDSFSFADSLIHFRGAEIYHIHGPRSGFICPAARLLTRARIIFHLHGAIWRAARWSFFTRFVIRAGCVVGAIAAHQIVTVSVQSSEVLSRLRLSLRKIVLVPNGRPSVEAATVPADATGLDLEPPFLLYVGRLVPEKQGDLLIRAFKSIRSPTRLLIVGPSPYTDEYEVMLRELARDDPRIVFTGSVDFHAIAELYRACLAVVLPSQTEGCSNVLLEALAYGCCIVTSDIEPNRDVVQDGALFFETDNLDSLTGVLSRVLHDGALVERSRSSARERARTMQDWDAVTREFLRLYVGRAPASEIAS